jgi:hypothetical protein
VGETVRIMKTGERGQVLGRFEDEGSWVVVGLDRDGRAVVESYLVEDLGEDDDHTESGSAGQGSETP